MNTFHLERLEAETFVRRVEYFAEIGSTNSHALELAADASLTTPLLVLTETQTAGRGRGANEWWSATGAITFSILVDAAHWNLATDRWPRVSLAAGVAVCEAVQALLPSNRVALKWPNDVHLDGRKTCGILVETPPRSGRLVVGVGLNVNNLLVDAPEGVRERATSLCHASGVEFNLTDVLVDVLRRIEENLALLAGEEMRLAEKWQALSALTGRQVTLDLGSRRVSGHCRGIDHEGALVLHTGIGQERFFAGVVAKF